MAGRYSELTYEMIGKAWDYVENHEDYGDVVPSVVGMALSLGVSRSTCYNWAKESEAFLHIFTRVSDAQERRLLSGGLSGVFNPAVTKMLLTKHGYSDKLDQTHTSPDGSMTPQQTIQTVDAKEAAIQYQKIMQGDE